VTLEIEAQMPESAREQLVRSVTENGRTVKVHKPGIRKGLKLEARALPQLCSLSTSHHATPRGAHTTAGRAQSSDGVRNIVIVDPVQAGMKRCALKDLCDVLRERSLVDFVHPAARSLKTAVPRCEGLTEPN
jgi:hypothetical protein